MKGKIISLVKELISLQQPYTLETLTPLFDNYKDLFDKGAKPPEKFSSLWCVLRSMRTQLLDWQQLAAEQQSVINLKCVIEKSGKQLTDIDAQMHRMKDELLQQQGNLNTVCPPLLKAYNDYLIEQEPIIAVAIPTNIRQQRFSLNAYLEILQDKFNSLEMNTIRLHVAEALLRRRELISQLKKLNIVVTENSSDTSQIYEKLKIISDQQNSLKQQLEGIQQELAENISNSDVEQEIANKTHLLEEANAELLSINVKINKNALSHEIKTILENDYQLASDKMKFIDEQEQTVRWSGSSFNPHSWYSWGTNPNFKTNLNQLQREFDYLQLLHQKTQLTSYIQSLTQQLECTQGFIKPFSATPKQSDGNSNLQKRALQLLVTYNPMYSSTNLNNVTLLMDVIDSMGPLSKKVDELDEGLRLLMQLIESDRTILELRTTHLLMVETDTLMPTADELVKLRSAETTRQQELSNLAEKIKNCKSCLLNMDTITDLNNKLKTLREEKRSKKSELKHLKAKQVSAPDCSNHYLKMEQTQHYTGLQIAGLDTALNEALALMDDPLTQQPEVSREFALLIAYQDNLNSWNRLIRDCNFSGSTRFQDWYQQLFIALQTHVHDEISYHQACQLLRDIHFELQHPNESANYPVLTEYQTLCPEPSHSWQILTNLKPSLPIGKGMLTDIQNQTLRDRLKALYQQQELLAKRYPKEGELLLQAIYNLHQGSILSELNPNHPSLNNLHFALNDPRYEPLQRHRGFNKVCEWLAEFCSFLLDLIKNKQEKSSYRQLFFFKPTQTVKLLNDATAALSNCVAG